MEKRKERSILVTSALPYANGPIHIGHLVEYIQTDIWVRFQKLSGNRAWYFCADDTHGTPIMIAARKASITPEELVERIHKEHYRDLTAYGVEFDNYYTTNSPENRELACYIYEQSKAKGHIDRRSVTQLYCEHDKMFLPDRFVNGTCPKCGAAGQYGDSCEACSATYNPQDLKDPACTLCGNTPVPGESEHLFFRLGDFTNFLREWLATPGRVHEGVRRKMSEWIEGGLRDWDISRDGPYFGFEIPGEKDKFFYVWLDAPIGYMASSKNYFDRRGESKIWESFWRPGEGDDSSEVWHFIGKDITYFHTLFWPSLLHVAGFRTPTTVHVHGFLTVNGEKMSKSRGTFVRAATYLKHLDPQALRFYFASRLGPGLDDLDLQSEDFIQRYNSEVVGNFTNLFSRLAGGIAKKLDHRLSDSISTDGEALIAKLLGARDSIASAYEERNYSRAVREIAALGDEINRYVNDAAPWVSIKESSEEARQTLTDALAAGRILATYLKPILPIFAAGVEELLAIEEPLSFTTLADRFSPGHQIRPYRQLSARLEAKQFEALFAEEREAAAAATATPAAVGSGLISIDQLQQVELRAAKILTAELVEGANKLLRLSVDLGEERPRQVIAGIRAAYAPEKLVGLTVVAVANLEPRKMRFGLSEAMLLASGEGESLTLWVAERSAKPGERLR